MFKIGQQVIASGVKVTILEEYFRPCKTWYKVVGPLVGIPSRTYYEENELTVID